MEEVELEETMKTGIALLLIPLSALILLANELLFHLSVLSRVDTGIVGEITFVLGWLLLITSTTYLAVSRFV